VKFIEFLFMLEGTNRPY